MPDLSILMPVFNERATAAEAIEGVLGADLPVGDFELIIVDDGSTDGTRELLREGSWPDNVRIVEHDANRGKGAAIRTALEHAEGTWSTIMDADLEYDPADFTPVLEPLIEGKAAAVFGTRAFEAHTAYSFWYVVGNKGVTFAANLLYNRWLSDIMTCHKAMGTDLFRSLPLRENGFAIEPEITAQLLVRGVQIYEVPIVYRARSRELGKKLTAADGFRVLRTLVRCRIAHDSGR
jgi:glycosyltransferase involved in cell wall biosynthesis